MSLCKPSLSMLVALNWVGHGLLACGLFAPCMTITPRLEPHTGLAEWLGLVDRPETYSIFSGVWKLLRGGNVAIGVVLLVCSVLIPLAKLVAYRAGLADLRSGRPVTPTHRLAAAIGKYSMVDVFVIALFVFSSQTFPGGTEIELLWGTYAFGGAALLSIAVGFGLGRAAESD